MCGGGWHVFWVARMSMLTEVLINTQARFKVNNLMCRHLVMAFAHETRCVVGRTDNSGGYFSLHEVMWVAQWTETCAITFQAHLHFKMSNTTTAGLFSWWRFIFYFLKKWIRQMLHYTYYLAKSPSPPQTNKQKNPKPEEMSAVWALKKCCYSTFLKISTVYISSVTGSRNPHSITNVSLSSLLLLMLVNSFMYDF